MTAVAPWQVWWIQLDPTVGHEQGKTRSGLIVSSRAHLRLTASRVVNVVPLTSQYKPLRHHVPVPSPHGTLYAITDQIRAVSVERLDRGRGCWKLDPHTADEVRECLRQMIDL